MNPHLRVISEYLNYYFQGSENCECPGGAELSAGPTINTALLQGTKVTAAQQYFLSTEGAGENFNAM